ncbi:hypothetical protein L1987_80360 [Smallanthus sonchifolius]|uniref:Uncharacterized protein n=1 Tax=Smallanthus sonchifolius TaxID=185202 RepID=A0ACB8YLT0_9ASTR|nr:hypothetical protein L1987_80360 [Smallanthus sonchifolius]
MSHPAKAETQGKFSKTEALVPTSLEGTLTTSLKGQLTEVDLSYFIASRLEEEALEVMSMFSSALEGSNLRYLNLSNNALGEKGVRVFSELLKSQSNLEELYLLNDWILEEVAQAVVELIPSTKKLKILHFHNNTTEDEGAIAISQLLKKSPVSENFRVTFKHYKNQNPPHSTST